MKFIHISDLHIGKRMGEYSLEDDHRYILNQIVKIAEYEDVDAVIEKMLSELKASGYDTIIEEANRQVQEYLDERK